jgi:molybdopterin-containing oxidoreductase family membrane subunit
MAADTYIMGVFTDEARAARAILDLKPAGFDFHRAHSPVPSHKIMDALGLKKSPVGWFTLAGGVVGFISGFLLGAYTSTQWNLIVSGKPVVALVPLFVLGFEFTILFSVFGNVIGLLACARLPDFRSPERYDPRCSGEHFGVVAACETGRRAELIEFFQKKGGEARVFT